ncbi:MAG: porphobilinogen synthase [Terrimicrobiaceae bacterium]|nr:porphobilinogen synthase [Terrimicrobiaceae bacterium]
MDLIHRPRRNRRMESIRRMVRETSLAPSNLIWPLFVHAGAEPIGVASMPGVVRHSMNSLLAACEQAVHAGLPAVAVFPAIDPGLKDAAGSHGLAPENILYTAVRAVKARFPELVVITDVALDPYTSHGHDGLLDISGNAVENDSTVDVLCRLAVIEAEAGADFVAPSDMMDGRIGAIRRALDAAGFQSTGILSYAAKYASAYYGPFREAVGSRIAGDAISKATYQMDPANVREARREIRLDESEGADIVMVKPAGPYLDVICAVRDATDLPLAAYQVSGEYSQIHAAARLGWLDLELARDESLVAIRRAGADMILTYFALDVAASLPR